MVAVLHILNIFGGLVAPMTFFSMQHELYPQPLGCGIKLLPTELQAPLFACAD